MPKQLTLAPLFLFVSRSRITDQAMRVAIANRFRAARRDVAIASAGPIAKVLAEVELEAFRLQQMLGPDKQAVKSGHRVQAGERYYRLFPEYQEPDVNININLLHEDTGFVVVNKPAPLPMHASGRYHRNTLEHLLNLVYAPEKLRPAHRLDANTTGVVVFSRSRRWARRTCARSAR